MTLLSRPLRRVALAASLVALVRSERLREIRREPEARVGLDRIEPFLL